MSSGFVSSGTSEAPIQRSDEWLAAQREIDSNIVAKQEAARAQEGKSLFETLQANKAAKEDAFQEANKLKNQFRSLDEDEIEFLDSVLESTRAEEERVKKETREGLEAFRKQQEEAEKGEKTDAVEGPVVEEDEWATGGRKRKRAKDKEVLKGVKLRKSSSAAVEVSKVTKEESVEKIKPKAENAIISKGTANVAAPPADLKPPAERSASKSMGTSLGLVAYGSDSEHD